MKKKKETLLYIGGVDWAFLKQRPQHLATELSKHTHVLYFEHTNLFQMVKSKKRFSMNNVERITDNLSILRIYGTLPNMHKNQILNDISCMIIGKSVDKYLKQNNLILSSIIIGNPFFAKVLKYIDVKFSIYDCVDDHSAFTGTNYRLVRNSEKFLTDFTDMVITTSDELYNRFSKHRNNVELISNGVNFNEFNKIANAYDQRIESIRSNASVICGFLGAVYDWIDIDLIEYAAKALPNNQFVIVGPVKTDIKKIANFNNVHFLGEVNYTDVPYYINQFDICMVPFKINELTKNANPIKVYEYFSLGKPVISTDLDELDKYSECLYKATDYADFVSGIQLLANNIDDQKLIRKRFEIAQNNSWASKAERIYELIDV